jgi:hypothetical protein
MSTAGARETRAFASEIKFLLPRVTGVAVRDWARQFLQPDPYGTGAFGDEYVTSTIYFESPGYDVFHRRKSFGRSKYRIRRYEGHSEVFLERKLRRPGMLTKRRSQVAASELSRLDTAELGSWPGRWFHRRLLLRELRPVCQIWYGRVARGGSGASGPIRLTLDDVLRVAPAQRPAFGSGDGAVRILEESMILELKFRAEVPSQFRQLIEQFQLEPQAVSKYRTGITALEPDRARAVEAGAAPIESATISGPAGG